MKSVALTALIVTSAGVYLSGGGFGALVPQARAENMVIKTVSPELPEGVGEYQVSGVIQGSVETSEKLKKIMKEGNSGTVMVVSGKVKKLEDLPAELEKRILSGSGGQSPPSR